MRDTEVEAHLEGAKNLYRYNRKDLFNVAVYVGVLALIALGCWAVFHVVMAFGHGCGPYGCGHVFNTVGHYRAPRSVMRLHPAYHPLYP